jgi:hypothetical protein
LVAAHRACITFFALPAHLAKERLLFCLSSCPQFLPKMTYPDFAARWRNSGGAGRTSYGHSRKTSATYSAS